MQSLLHQGSPGPKSLKKFFIYSVSTLKTNRTALSFTFYQFFTLIGSKGWRSGESSRLPPMWPGFGPASTPYVGWVCCCLSLAPRGFSPGIPVFPSPQKLTLPNSNSIWNARTRLNEFIWTPRYFVSKKAIEIFLRKCCRFLSFMPLSKTIYLLGMISQSLQFLAISKDPYRQRIPVTCVSR